MKKIIVNPFTIFFITITVVVCVYFLAWSKLFLELANGTLIFLGVVMALSLAFSKVYNIVFPVGTFTKKTTDTSISLFVIIGLIAIVADLAYERVVPILEVLVFKSGYRYTDFVGIPTVHVFVVTFSSFLGIWLWDEFLKQKKLNFLLLGLLFASYPLILFNRGGFIMNLSSMFFVYFLRRKNTKVTFFHLLSLLVFMVAGLYVFGIAGNYRSGDADDKYNQSGEFIINAGRATDEFKASAIPPEFFWGYLYTATPIGNLDHMIKEMEPTEDFLAFTVSSILPDFAAKRLQEARNISIPKDKLVIETFNVSTMFAPAYKTLGFPGMYLLFIFYSVTVFGYSVLMKRLDTTKVVGISILFTITIFNLFTNMLTFSGLSFQLVYPLVIAWYKKMRG